MFYKTLLLVFLFISKIACAETIVFTHEGIDRNIELQYSMDEEVQVEYKGVLNLDDAGIGSHAMLYPADTGAMFIGALITHLFISESAKEGKKNKIQKEADKVLIQYEGLLEEFTYTHLRQYSKYKFQSHKGDNDISTKAVGINNSWAVKATPVFFMSKTAKTISISNAMQLFKRDNPEPIYENLVEVYSLSFDGDASSHWNQISSDNLRSQLIEDSVELFTLSLEYFLIDAFQKGSRSLGQEKTFKYKLEGERKYERGTLVNETCYRQNIRTLRGWIKSVPLLKIKENSECVKAF